MWQEIFHLLWHSLLDTLKTLPFLLLAYLLIEYIEHRAGDGLTQMLSRFGRFSPLAGAVTGLVPQCGFSVAAVKLYTGQIISFGTLVAVFVATSDEAIPVLLSHPEKYSSIVWLLLLKLPLACVTGFVVDLIEKKPLRQADHSCAHLKLHAHCHHAECHRGILRPAVHHALQSALYIFVVILIMETAVALIGENTIVSLFNSQTVWQPLLASVVGLIPNCASSIILTELFAENALSFGALVAGLTTNAGVAYAVLFRSNKRFGQNLLIVGLLSALALITGYLLQILSL